MQKYTGRGFTLKRISDASGLYEEFTGVITDVAPDPSPVKSGEPLKLLLQFNDGNAELLSEAEVAQWCTLSPQRVERRNHSRAQFHAFLSIYNFVKDTEAWDKTCSAMGYSSEVPYDWKSDAGYGAPLLYGTVGRWSSAFSILQYIAAAMLITPGTFTPWHASLSTMALKDVPPTLHHIRRPAMLDDLKVASPLIGHAVENFFGSASSKSDAYNLNEEEWNLAERNVFSFTATLHNSGAAPLSLQPRNEWEMKSRADADSWRSAERVEMETIVRNDTFDVVSALPPGVTPLNYLWTYKYKHSVGGSAPRYKARLVVDGRSQRSDSYNDCYASTLRFSNFRLLAALAASEKMYLCGLDIKGAFLHASLPQTIYLKAPRGFYAPNQYLKLNKSLYGLRQAPRLFQEELARFMLRIGFEVTGDGVTWARTRLTATGVEERLLVGAYVDDLAVCSSSMAEFDTFIEELKGTFELSEHGRMTSFLGAAVHQDPTTFEVAICQKEYAERLLDAFKPSGGNKRTPLPPGAKFKTYTGHATTVSTKWYASVVGSCLYLQALTRPDISYACSQLSRYLKNPGPEHLAAANYLLCYIAGTSHLGIRYSALGDLTGLGQRNDLSSFVDADWAGDLDTRISQTGFIIFLAGGLVDYRSARQRCISLSSAESEFVAASEVARNIKGLRLLLRDFGLAQEGPTYVGEDNAAVVAMQAGSSILSRSRHIDTRQYFLRELYGEKHIQLIKVPGGDNPADALTKSLSSPTFLKHREHLVQSCSGLFGITEPASDPASL